MLENEQVQGPIIEVELPPCGMNLKELQDSIEKQLIEQALLFARGNKARAAELLFVNRTTLIAKMHKHGMIVGDNHRPPGPYQSPETETL